MSLNRIISISLIVYASMTALIVLMGLYILPSQSTIQPVVQQPVAIADTSPIPTSTPSASSSSPALVSSTISSDPSTPTVPTTTNTTSSTPTAVSRSTPTQVPAPTPTPSPTPTPPPTPACGSAGGTCTSAQVLAHSSAGNCWMIYSNKYYIVTSYVSQHPGGSSVFNSNTCGRDITGYMNGSQSTAGKNQKHSGSAYTILNSYYVGPVSG